MIDRHAETLAATVLRDRLYRDLAAAHDRLVERVEGLEETVGLLSQIINVLAEQ